MRGSTNATSTSARRLQSTYATAVNTITASMTGRLRWFVAVTARSPMPGHPKTVSTMITPPIR